MQQLHREISVLGLVNSVLLAALLMLAADSLKAQTGLSDSRPLDDVIELPNFSPPPVSPGDILPAPQSTESDTQYELFSGQRFVLRSVQFSGNTVIARNPLDALVAPLLNTEISVSQLQHLRDQVTRLYISKGYINSGAVIPGQQIQQGKVRIHIIEGQLSQVDVSTDGEFSADYFSRRILHAAQPVLNVQRLEQRLYQFHQDPRIQRVDAELKPGDQPGESRMTVSVQEADPVSQSIEVNNHHAPSIGAEGVYYSWRHGNWQGNGELLYLGLEKTRGLNGIDVLYETPVNANDDSIAYFARLNQSDVVEGDFEALDIESRSGSLGVSFKQQLENNLHKSFHWFVTGELQRSESYLLGDTFSFSPGPENGVSRISVVRTGPDMQWRSRQRVLAARATLSMGMDILNATRHDDQTADGVFVSLLLQGQWAQRFQWLNSTLISRLDMQLADSSLLGLEQFVIGGHNSVRGYRENSLVRDQGAAASLEWRVPFYNDTGRHYQHAIALFYDAGYAKNKQLDVPGPSTLSSAGIGLLGQFSAHWHYQLYWANALKEVSIQGESDLQDDGIHFRMSYRW